MPNTEFVKAYIDACKQGLTVVQFQKQVGIGLVALKVDIVKMCAVYELHLPKGAWPELADFKRKQRTKWVDELLAELPRKYRKLEEIHADKQTGNGHKVCAD